MPGEAGARIAATASRAALPVNDGSGDSIAVDVTSACEEECTAAEPQAIADTVGTFIHGDEVDLLTVQLDTPFQLGFDCGFDAESCYYGGENKIVLSGNDEVAADGASRELRARPRVRAPRRPAPPDSRPFRRRDQLGDGALVQLRARLPGPPRGGALPWRRGQPLLRGPGRGLRRVLRPQPLPGRAGRLDLGAGAEAERRRLRGDPPRHALALGRTPELHGQRPGTAARRRRSGIPHTVRRRGQRRPGRRPEARLRADPPQPLRQSSCAAPARASASATASITRSAASPGCASRSSPTAPGGGAST